MEDQITFPDIADFKLGVDEPIILMANATSGAKITYEISDGAANVDLVDGTELRPKAVGSVTVDAVVPANGQYPEIRVSKTFNIVDGTYYERLDAISIIRKKLDNDTLDLNQVAKYSVREINTLTFTVNEDKAYVVINGEKFEIDYKRFVLKFIQSATDFWVNEITQEEIRLAALRTTLKTIDPA